MAWTDRLDGDPVPWLLEPEDPAVRAAALQRLLDRPADDPDVAAARRAAMATGPIAAILDAQQPDGWWVKPGPGYAPKYTGTVWSLIFLDQLGADPADERVQRACTYVLRTTPTAAGGLGCSGSHRQAPPPPSTVIHCLNGNLLRALIGFGHLDDERVQAAVSWAARAITGEGMARYYATGTSGPGFACGSNEGLPCAWGAIKELLALARIPDRRRSPEVRAAIAAGVQFLLSRDPAVADYPMGWGNTKPSGSWFKLGFPSGYVADVLQTLEVLGELGHGQDPRLGDAMALVLAQQGPDGRWRNRYAYHGRTWGDIERQGAPSKWVTLRACTVLRRAG
ncbi:MAG: hypothetical protein MUF35_10215 [Candidatus Nanopelagicales bacterium]|jgi:hypothetical protein|nr:hypothetical protein [Candidatus Nanopelagicales bacterium]